MQEGNYIKINRKILEWEWYHDINTFRLFMYMLLKANWKDGKFMGETIPRGAFVSSLQRLSDDTDLSIDEVRTGIKHLLRTGEITKQSTSKYTVFTVVNYCLYQLDSQANPNRFPIDSQSIPNRFPTIEERKKERRKEGNIYTPARFDDFWSNYPLDKNRAAAERAYCDVVITGLYPEEDLVAAAKNYAEYCKLTGTDKMYHASNFLLKVVFEDYMPDKYKKPQSKNVFNNFAQNDYDFDELEKDLLSN